MTTFRLTINENESSWNYEQLQQKLDAIATMPSHAYICNDLEVATLNRMKRLGKAIAHKPIQPQRDIERALDLVRQLRPQVAKFTDKTMIKLFNKAVGEVIERAPDACNRSQYEILPADNGLSVLSFKNGELVFVNEENLRAYGEVFQAASKKKKKKSKSDLSPGIDFAFPKIDAKIARFFINLSISNNNYFDDFPLETGIALLNLVQQFKVPNGEIKKRVFQAMEKCSDCGISFSSQSDGLHLILDVDVSGEDLELLAKVETSFAAVDISAFESIPEGLCLKVRKLVVSTKHDFAHPLLEKIPEIEIDISSCSRLSDFNKDIPYNKLSQLTCNGGKRITLTGHNEIPCKTYIKILKEIPANWLKGIDLSHHSSLTNDQLKSVLHIHKSLTFLNLSGCTNVELRNIFAFFECGNELRDLSMDGCKECDLGDFKIILKSCPKLERASLRDWGKIDLYSPDAFHGYSFEPVLKFLDLSGSFITVIRNYSSGFRIVTSVKEDRPGNNKLLGMLLPSSLEELWLDGISVTEDCIKEFTKNCLSLKILSLSGSQCALNRASLELIGDNCKELEYIYLRNFEGDCITVTTAEETLKKSIKNVKIVK